jgi:hypothetical protein
LAVSLLLTNSDLSTLPSSRTAVSSITRLCSTRNNRRILDVGASGSKADGKAVPVAVGGDGASAGASDH